MSSVRAATLPDVRAYRKHFQHAHVKVSADSATTTLTVSDARTRVERGAYAPRGGQPPPRKKRARTETIEVEVPVQDPPGWPDIAAFLAFRRGADLGHSMSADQLGMLERRFVAILTVPQGWTDHDSEEYAADLRKALRYARGMPWLRPDALVALIVAEEAAARVIPGSEDMFAALKGTQPSGWRPIVDELTKAGATAGVNFTVEAALTALYAWAAS